MAHPGSSRPVRPSLSSRAARPGAPATVAARGSPARDASPPDLDPVTRSRLERIWRRAYGAHTQADLLALYADWSQSYDEDHEAIGFTGHLAVVEALQRHLAPGDGLAVLDAGAGTGLAGLELARRGYGRLTALDLSPAMLEQARGKGVYERLLVGDLAWPVDALADDAFDAAVLVGVFSYGQAPAHALDEVLRVVRPGGRVVFTLRTDFHEQDAMGVASRLSELEAEGAWRLLETTPPAPYLPRKDPEARFRVWVYEVLPVAAEAPEDFAAAVGAALDTPGPVKPIAHQHIWDAVASRLYDAYIRHPDYYLNECEEEILRVNAGDFLGDRALCVELGCGSAQKIRHVFDAVLAADPQATVEYMPIDVSPGALETTQRQIEEAYGSRVHVQPRLGSFDETLAAIPADRAKAIFFLGGSIGNFESLDQTADFLSMVRGRMTPKDRFVVGFDLCKGEDVLDRAYNAGAANRSFFVHMVRRMNRLLGARFDLDAFRLGSVCEPEPEQLGISPLCVKLRVVTDVEQASEVPALGRSVRLPAGTAVQVGVSRKFTTDDVATLATLAGLRVRSLWFDARHYFAAAELVRSDAPAA